MNIAMPDPISVVDNFCPDKLAAMEESLTVRGGLALFGAYLRALGYAV